MQCGKARSVFAHPARPFAAHIDRRARAVGGIHEQLNGAMKREVFSYFIKWSITELTYVRAFEGQQDCALGWTADGQRTIHGVECDSLRNAHGICVANYVKYVEKPSNAQIEQAPRNAGLRPQQFQARQHL